MQYDLIVVGMGISGISAAIYAKNSGLNVLMLEKNTPGGLLNKINTINNYPGVGEITGPDLSYKLFQSVNDLQITYKIAEVENIILIENKKVVQTNIGDFEAKYVILATGRKNRNLGLKNEEQLIGHGISTCALCDGALYKGKEIVVVGGGNSALEETLYLANIVKKVYLIHRRDAFRAEFSLIKKVEEKENIEILYNSTITSIKEENGKLKEVVINDKIHLEVEGLFTYIGYEANNFLKDLDIYNETNYIKVNENYETSIQGIYAVGDCIEKKIYQLITAANDGAVAGIHVSKEIKKN